MFRENRTLTNDNFLYLVHLEVLVILVAFANFSQFGKERLSNEVLRNLVSIET